MRYLLFPFSILFFVISEIRNFIYDRALLNIKKVNIPVICVGNITTGGTGKTPWVQFVSQYLDSKGKKVAIVSRGYGGDYEGVLEVNDDMDAKLCGDEPLWLKRNTNAWVYLSKDRYQGAVQVIAEKKPDVIILDDGFQHRKLNRDLDIVLLDASAPMKTYWPLPMGRLRESFKGLCRAEAIIINKCNYSADKEIERLLSYCEPYIKGGLWKADFVFQEWQALFGSMQQSFVNKNISICCGLGNPDAFVKTVKDQNFSPIETFIFPDHFYWKPIDIEKMTYRMKSLGSYDLMVTEKDAVKLARYEKHFQEMGVQLWVCKMHVKIHADDKALLSQIDKVVEV